MDANEIIKSNMKYNNKELFVKGYDIQSNVIISTYEISEGLTFDHSLDALNCINRFAVVRPLGLLRRTIVVHRVEGKFYLKLLNL